VFVVCVAFVAFVRVVLVVVVFVVVVKFVIAQLSRGPAQKVVQVVRGCVVRWRSSVFVVVWVTREGLGRQRSDSRDCGQGVGRGREGEEGRREGASGGEGSDIDTRERLCGSSMDQWREGEGEEFPRGVWLHPRGDMK
jgi:uncharacterized membrane protein YgcG